MILLSMILQNGVSRDESPASSAISAFQPFSPPPPITSSPCFNDSANHILPEKNHPSLSLSLVTPTAHRFFSIHFFQKPLNGIFTADFIRHLISLGQRSKQQKKGFRFGILRLRLHQTADFAFKCLGIARIGTGLDEPSFSHGIHSVEIHFISRGCPEITNLTSTPKQLDQHRRSNPSKRIFLLGDATHKRSVRGVAEFVDFESLGGTEKERAFQQPVGWARLEKN